MQSMLELIDSRLAQNRYTRCTAVTVRVGLLSAVDEEALSFAFETLCEQTEHNGAVLTVEKTYPTANCGCGCRFKVTDLVYICPDCGAITAALSGGDELDVIKLEVE